MWSWMFWICRTDLNKQLQRIEWMLLANHICRKRHPNWNCDNLWVKFNKNIFLIFLPRYYKQTFQITFYIQTLDVRTLIIRKHITINFNRSLLAISAEIIFFITFFWLCSTFSRLFFRFIHFCVSEDCCYRSDKPKEFGKTLKSFKFLMDYI